MIVRCLLLLGCLWLPIVSDAAATASTAPPASGETLRLQRLAAVAALWTEVKYFHPYVATRPVDWDKALVDTLPRINAAKTSDDYRAAIDGMLATLNDPSTRTLEAPGKALPNAKADPSPMVPPAFCMWTLRACLPLSTPAAPTRPARACCNPRWRPCRKQNQW